MKPKLENVIVELASKAAFVAELPFSMYYFKGNILIWWPCMKP